MLKNRLTQLVLAAALPAFVHTSLGQVQVFRGGGYLGVEIRDVQEEDVQTLRLARAKGVVVDRVAEGSAAEEAGLAVDDVILEYLGVPVISVRQFQRLISETPVGRKVDLAVSRSGQQITLNARLGEREGHFGSLGAVRIPRFDFDFGNFDWREHMPHDFDFDFDRLESDDGNRIVIMSTRPRLGITGTPLTEQMAEFLKVPRSQGVLVTEVRADSPAAEAGLKAGDVIVSVAGEAIDSPHHLSRGLKDGKSQIEVYRNGQSMTLEVEIESKRPSRLPRNKKKL